MSALVPMRVSREACGTQKPSCLEPGNMSREGDTVASRARWQVSETRGGEESRGHRARAGTGHPLQEVTRPAADAEQQRPRDSSLPHAAGQPLNNCVFTELLTFHTGFSAAPRGACPDEL